MRITTLLRLADDTTRPIVIEQAGSQWHVVTIDNEPVKHCRRGHVLLSETTRIDRYGYRVCKVCERRRNRAAALRYYHRTGKRLRRQRQRRAAWRERQTGKGA